MFWIFIGHLLQVRATYPDGRVAKGISVNATVKGVDTHKKFTSGDGLARFELNVGNPRGDLEVLVRNAPFSNR